VGLIGLLETKVKEKNVEKVADKICQGWQWFYNFSHGNRQRIWVAWNPKCYKVQMLSFSTQFMHCRVWQNLSNKAFFITYVYGENYDGPR